MRPGCKDYQNIRLNNGFRSFKIFSQRRPWEVIITIGANLRDGGSQHSNWTEQHTVVLLFGTSE